MNKLLFNIIAWPLVALTSGGVAYSVAETNKNRNLTETVTQITNENKQLKSDRDKLEEKVLNLGVEMINKQNTIKTLEDEKTTLTTRLTTISEELSDAEQAKKDLQDQLNAEIARAQRLSEENESLKQPSGVMEGIYKLEGMTENPYYTIENGKLLMAGDPNAHFNCYKVEDNKLLVYPADIDIEQIEASGDAIQPEMILVPNYETKTYTMTAEHLPEPMTMVKVTYVEYYNYVADMYAGDFAELEQRISDLQQEKSALELTIEEKNTRIAELESQVDQLQDDIIALRNRITELENGVINRANLKIVNGIFKLSEGSNSLIIQFVDNKTLNIIQDIRTGTYASTDKRNVATGCEYSINQNGVIIISNYYPATSFKLVADEENNTYIFDSSFSLSSSFTIEKLGDETRDINEVLAEINAELGYSDSSSTEVVCTYLLNPTVGKLDCGGISMPGAWTVSFNSNGQDFKLLHISDELRFQALTDEMITVSTTDMVTRVNEEYRTINFYEEPTGDLLTWLNRNATLQS